MIYNFRNIKYPLFGCFFVPYKIEYDVNKIWVQKTRDSTKKILDDTSLSVSYLERLLQLDIKEVNRFKFNVTALSLEQLLATKNKIKWGVDASASIYSGNYPLRVPLRIEKVRKQKDNLFWVNNISYPFFLPKHYIEIDLKPLFAKLVNIDLVWYLYDFSFFKEVKTKIVI